MTEQSAVIRQVRVLDAMCLIHFGRADRLDVLRDLLVDKECWTTQVVVHELLQGAAAHPAMRDVDAADWLKVAQLDTLDEIRIFTQWVSRMGSGERDLGEASVFAVAELRSATAITDDQERCVSPELTAWKSMALYGCSRGMPGWQALGIRCGEPSRCPAGDRTQTALHGSGVSQLRASARTPVGALPRREYRTFE